MRKLNRLVWVMVLSIGTRGTLSAAEVKKSSGEVLSGKIRGFVVQHEIGEGSGSLTIRKGSDITAIDEQGVHFREGSEVTHLVTAVPGGAVLRIKGKAKEGGTDANPVLGEYRGNRPDALAEPLRRALNDVKGAVSPVLTLQTDGGSMTIDVSDIVGFARKD